MSLADLLSRARRAASRRLAGDVPDRVGPDVFERLKEELSGMARPRVLEIGARDVTGESLRDLMQLGEHDYTGFDLYPGSGVDVAGDVHRLSDHVPPGHFDAVVSKSVFEHLAMPWKVVLEINRVLRIGGVCFINTFQTFPLHETPADFFRFSEYAWQTLFNRWTGFEIVAAGMNGPCRVVHRKETPRGWVKEHTAYINSDVLARKLGPYDEERLRWNVVPSDVLTAPYPPPAAKT